MRENLGLALGEEQELGAAEHLDLGEFERAVARACKLQPSIEQRPDVAAARMRLEVPERLVDDAELQYAPTLDLVSQLQYATKVNFGPKLQWNVQGVLNVPIYDGTRCGHRRGEPLARRAGAAGSDRDATSGARGRGARAARGASGGGRTRGGDRSGAISSAASTSASAGATQAASARASTSSLRPRRCGSPRTRWRCCEYEVGKARAGAVLANAECSY